MSGERNYFIQSGNINPEARSGEKDFSLSKKLEAIYHRAGEVLSPARYKILEFSEAEAVTNALKKSGKTVVLVSGVFDLMHIGHFTLLENARAMGDILAITIPTDEQVKVNKHPDRPITPLDYRLKALSSVEFVDYVFPQSSWLMMEVLALIKPSIYAVWEKDEQIVSRLRQAEQHGIELRLVTADTAHFSSTKLLEIIQKLR